MRKYLVEIIIGILVILSIGVVLALGYLSYTRISTIVATIHNDARPNKKLAHIKELALDLEKAENSIRIYAFTQASKDLSYYRKLLKNRDTILSSLKSDGEGNEKFLANVDTIQMLVNNKIRVWKEMIPLYGARQTSQYLDTLSGTLESKIIEDSIRKNRNIFKKVFQRNKKSELNKEQIVQDIEQRKQQDIEVSKAIRKQELELAATNSQLTERLYNLIHKMEDEESIILAEKELKANALADQTYFQVKRIAIGGVIAALLVILVILRYTQSTRASQRALQKAKDETERLAAAKEQFVANVSHEIRTPVNLISGFTARLLSKKMDREISDDLLIVKSSSDHLARVVDDVLDFSKLQSDKMKLYPVHFSLPSLVNEIYQLFKVKIEKEDISISYSIADTLPEFLFGDPVRLKQILINLLGNAIKFSPGGNVNYTINKAKEQSNEEVLNLEISVSDDGIGIDKEKLDVIFEDYTQAESDTTKKYGGTGLGLSIVKKLVDLHKGNLSVSSEKGRGTRFTCIIPYAVGQAKLVESHREEKKPIPASIKNLKVLIVDDEAYNRKLIKNMLDGWQLESEEAGDGMEAIEILKDRQFDVVLLDLRMPRLNGIKVSQFIRETLKLDASILTIILITATAVSPEDEKNYEASGMDTWLPKPFKEKELLDVFLNIKHTKKEETPSSESTKNSSKIQISSSVNFDDLIRVANNDDAFVKDMLERLLSSFDEAQQNIRQAIGKGNAAEIGETTHKLASPSRHIGAHQLLDAIKNLEKLAISKADQKTLQNAFIRLQEEIKKVKQAVNNYLAKK